MFAQRARRGLRIALALVIGITLCELGLRAAGWVYLAAAGRPRAIQPVGDGGVRLLCLGDSNTFGMYEAAPDTYPARLEAWLDARVAGAPHAVINRGMPGLSTGHLASSFAAQLDSVRPDAVLLLCGVNNGWSWRGDQEILIKTAATGEGVLPPAPALPAIEPPWYESLRLWKAGRLLRARLREASRRESAAPLVLSASPQPAQSGIEPRVLPGDFPKEATRDGQGERVLGVGRESEPIEFDVHSRETRLADAEFRGSVVTDVRRMAALAHERAIPLYLLTYASEEGGYGIANNSLRRVAKELDLPLIECAGVFTPLSARVGFAALFYPDQHPKAVGYELIARLSFNVLVRSGLVRGEPLGDPLQDLPLSRREEPPIRLEGTRAAAEGARDELCLVIEGEEPGRSYQVLLSRSEERASAVWNGLLLPVEKDELFERTCTLPALSGEFDSRGGARVPLAGVLSESERALPAIKVAYVTFVAKNRKPRWFSDAAVLVLR